MRFLIYTKVSLRHVFDVCYVLRVENYVKYMGFRRVTWKTAFDVSFPNPGWQGDIKLFSL